MRLEEKELEGVRKGPKFCARFPLTTLLSVVSGKSLHAFSARMKDMRLSFLGFNPSA
jgi:hypothetical protein